MSFEVETILTTIGLHGDRCPYANGAQQYCIKLRETYWLRTRATAPVPGVLYIAEQLEISTRQFYANQPQIQVV